MIQIKQLSVHYKHIKALKNVSLEVPQASVVALLGTNGSGKSTLLKAVSKIVNTQSGTISFNNLDITNKSPNEVVRLGIIHCPEGRRIFPKFTVKENLIIGAYARKNAPINQDLEMVFHYFPRLKERFTQMGATLSGGEQQMLAIGRALMGGPKVLLLDEPSLGLAPNLVQEIFQILKKINQDGITILLVEQNASKALEICNYAYVLETGEVKLEGTARELILNDEIRKLYMGA